MEGISLETLELILEKVNKKMLFAVLRREDFKNFLKKLDGDLDINYVVERVKKYVRKKLEEDLDEERIEEIFEIVRKCSLKKIVKGEIYSMLPVHQVYLRRKRIALEHLIIIRLKRFSYGYCSGIPVSKILFYADRIKDVWPLKFPGEPLIRTFSGIKSLISGKRDLVLLNLPTYIKSRKEFKNFPKAVCFSLKIGNNHIFFKTLLIFGLIYSLLENCYGDLCYVPTISEKLDIFQGIKDIRKDILLRDPYFSIGYSFTKKGCDESVILRDPLLYLSLYGCTPSVGDGYLSLFERLEKSFKNRSKLSYGAGSSAR